jgi:hypothetical protein
MPIFYFDVNFVYDKKLVPITRQSATSIGPAGETIVRKRMEGFPRMGPYGNKRRRFCFFDCCAILLVTHSVDGRI